MPVVTRAHYVAHRPFTLPNGSTFKRGDVLKSSDALAFEAAVAAGHTDVNNATPGATDPEA